jgi:hypothetical protein
VTQPLSPEALAWLRQSAAFGCVTSQVLINLLERAEALEARPQLGSRAALAQPEGGGPTLADVDELCVEFGFHYDDTQGESLEILQQMVAAAITRWGRLATLPAPEAELLVDMLNQGAIALDSLCNKIVGECRTVACLHRGGWIRGAEPVDPSVATCPELEKAAAMRRAATLLSQLSAPAPVVVPVVDRTERQRIVKRGIVAGYNLGHHHTVEGCWGDPDEVADDYAEEALQDLGDEPALVAVVYDAGDGITIHRASQAPEAWAVRRDMDCLALDGTWSYEPRTSSRTEEWLARHRFTSAEAAAHAIPFPQAGEVEA